MEEYIRQMQHKIWLLEKGAELSGNEEFSKIADLMKSELAEKTAAGVG